jgi:hypothetical protein
MQETLSLTEMPNFSIRNLESLNNREIAIVRAGIKRIGLSGAFNDCLNQPFARRQGDG